jgi:hypothetical protein
MQQKVKHERSVNDGTQQDGQTDENEGKGSDADLGH